MANTSLRQASAHSRRDRLGTLRESLPGNFYAEAASALDSEIGRSSGILPAGANLLGSPLLPPSGSQRMELAGGGTAASIRARDLLAIKALIFSDRTWYLLPVLGLGLLSPILGFSPGMIFFLNFLGLIPLARMLGDATEEVAVAVNSETIGGLLNATFGNAIELIITIQTINQGLITVTKGTLLGSILSNMLLVLGMSLFFGGLGAKGKQQVFNESGPLANMTMLLLASLAFLVPTLMAQDGSDNSAVLPVSRSASICTLASYFAFLVFQLYTHTNMFEDEKVQGNDEVGQEAAVGATMSLGAAIGVLFGVTILTSMSSDHLVSCIDTVVREYGISQTFIGVILLPIIGNACEHVSAIRMAMHDKPILSIGIAVGSSTQIAMFVIPLSVIYAWVAHVDMDLDFKLLNAIIFMLSVIIVTVILLDGKSQWLEGFMLQMTYCIIACAYWFDQDGM